MYPWLLSILFSPGLGEAMDMASKESISIPFGTGICGHVAETKETIYIKDAYNVSYFKTINFVSNTNFNLGIICGFRNNFIYFMILLNDVSNIAKICRFCDYLSSLNVF